jgi:methylmalonyl-CoA mutase N-terminal domain/subunit
MGGALTGIEQGYQQREIQESAYRMQRDIEAKRRIVVGVNEYVEEEPPISGLLRVDPEVGERQRAKLARLRTERDNARVDAALKRIEDAAHGSDNMVPLLIEAVESYVTLGEICRVLRGVWGEQRESLVI